MTDRPLVSIGISFYNPGHYLPLAVKSVFAQSFEDWELILVDDGSTDGSVEFARRIADPRVRVMVDGGHRNLNIRLNQIVREARGEYFFRMDADDIMHPSRLERQLGVLKGLGEDAVLGSGCYSIDRENRVVGRRHAFDTRCTGFAARHSFLHNTVAARTSWFRAHPYSEDSLFYRSEDAELWCRTASKTQFLAVDEPLVYYREVGMFSFANYLGSTLGILYLTNEYASSRALFVFLLTREIAKCWLTSLAYGLGRADWIVRNRFHSISAELQARAQKDLDEVLDVVLPIRAYEGDPAVNAVRVER